MNSKRPPLISLDIGNVRTGIAYFDGIVTIAVPIETVVTENLERRLRELVGQYNVSKIIVGYPRNMRGEPTAQTEIVESIVASSVTTIPGIEVVFQDESLTSVVAQERLIASGRSLDSIDSMAAAVILEDYLRGIYG